MARHHPNTAPQSAASALAANLSSMTLNRHEWHLDLGSCGALSEQPNTTVSYSPMGGLIASGPPCETLAPTNSPSCS
jgi:hypothetical protein